MLRLAEPLLSSRFGGWALTESHPQRTASGGRHWSLFILLAAAIVAMVAVLLDVRLPSTPGSTATSTEMIAGNQAPAFRPSAASQPRIEPSAPVSPDRGSPSATARANPSAEASQPTAARPAATASSGIETASASAAVEAEADSSEAAAAGDAAVGEGFSTADAAITSGDPASRIRAYLGIHAGAQLPVFFTYEVQAGDTASSIAQRFGLEEATVLFNNFDIYDANHLTPGQRLQLPPIDGLVYTVQPGDTLTRLEQNYQADFEATVAFPSNGITSPEQIQVGQQLLLVQGSASVASSASASVSSSDGGGQSAQVWAEPTFVWPLGPDGISDPFGTPRANAFGYHTGVDFLAPIGTFVGSTAAGQVTVATWDPSYGNWVEISHGGGYRSRYAHLDEIWVREGEWVQSNAYIGTVGNTGNSSGAHLHFEIIIDGQAVNPLAWLN